MFTEIVFIAVPVIVALIIVRVISALFKQQKGNKSQES